MGRSPKPTKGKAKPAVSRKSSKNDGAKARDLEQRLAEALAREQATGDILRVIGSSSTDIQPVLNTMAESAARLCKASDSSIFRLDGDQLRRVAHCGSIPAGVIGEYAVPLARGNFAGRAALDGQIVHIADAQAEAAEFPGGSERARRLGFRAILCIPLVREGVAIGVISLRDTEVRLFTERQISLLQTFADQAVIAIENVRLFNETKEALERQTATSDILRVISSSPTDVQPVFEAVLASGVRLCGAQFGGVFRFDGELIHLVTSYEWPQEYLEALRRHFPMAPGDGSLVARAIRDRRVVQTPDYVAEARAAAGTLPPWVSLGETSPRSTIAIPMMREGSPLGGIVLARAEPGLFSDQHVALLQTFADQAVIAIENVRLFNETKEALERQTATSEILRIISSSPTDVQPVLDAIARCSVELCDAYFANVFLVEGGMVHWRASHNVPPEANALMRSTYPLATNADEFIPRIVREQQVLVLEDAQDPDLALHGHNRARAIGHRSWVAVPLLREGSAIGVLAVSRREVKSFSERQIDLLKIFADQAVIAIENVRLFTELQASNRELTTALDKQTATSEILRVISQSQMDVQPVFDAIVHSAVRLLGAYSSTLNRIEGDQIELAAITSTDDAGNAALMAAYPQSLYSEWTPAQAIRDRAPLNIANAQTDPRLPEAQRAAARARGYRSQVVMPLLRQAEAIGALGVTRREPGGFTDDEIALLQTFADQAVIAIENVRLFTELQEKNEALTQAHAQVTESLEQQTAMSDILKVIASSSTDLAPVFDTICQSAIRLCGAYGGLITSFDGTLVHLAAVSSPNPDANEHVRREYPRRPDVTAARDRAILERAVVHIPDTDADSEYTRQVAREFGYRRLLYVPMLRDGQPIGSIGMSGGEPGPYTEQQIELLKTFADQAVIAIENVRLFTELQARTKELTRSVDQLTALGEVGRALSSTLNLETVLTTIVSRAVQLSGLDDGVVFEYDEATEEFVQRVATESAGLLAEARRATRIRKGEGVVGRTANTLELAQVPDITLSGAYEGRLRETLIAGGVRAVLAVPMLSEDHLIGCLAVTRNAPGEFPAETMELLRTFATQSALAIQNARLFREIEEKSRQLEVASQHKSEFLANMSHELRTPLNAIIGFSEVLSEKMFGELNEKQEEYSKDIHASGQHLLSLINDILDLSKIEAGRMELELSDFHLPTALDSALTLVRERAGRRSIALHLSVDERLGQIQADERKVRQVVLNLLSNAIKFTPEGGRIEVAAAPKDGVVEVSVSDTGVGIAPEDQEAVFEEFRQVGTADKKVEGTGLGLTLCRKFVELHGGRIWVKSQLGAGSTFTFTIPVRRGE